MSKIDPTKTKMLRERFERDLRKRFNRVRSAIVTLIVRQDVFGMATSEPLVNTKWKARTSDKKLKLFQEWLNKQVGKEFSNEEYWEQYIKEAYNKGGSNAYNATRKGAKATATNPDQLAFYEGGRQEFLASAFNTPASKEKVKLMASRVFTDLQGVNEAMSTQMTRVLTDGMINGENPRKLAAKLVKAVDGIGKNRAMTIARTETIRVHAEGQLDAFAVLGVEELGVMTEWDTANDDRVCKLCVPLDGITVSPKEARGMIPRHPNCRCAWIPANVGEDKSAQKRGKRARAAMDKSVGKEIPASATRSVATQKRKSPWQGASKKIGKPHKDILDD